MKRNSLAQRLLTERIGRPVEDVLRELYIDKRHSDQEIAEALSLTRAVVQQWREQFGIRREDRPPVVIEPAVPA